MRKFQFIQFYLYAFIAFLLLVFLTLYLFFQLHQKAENKIEQLFLLRTESAQKTIQSRLIDYTQILKGAKGLIAIADTITRSEWKSYIDHLDVNKNYPGIQGIGYTMFVHPDELSQAEMKIAKDYPGFKIYPLTERPQYSFVLYLEPMTEMNKRAIGFDMFNEPTRRDAMQRAMDLNQPALTDIVKLVQESTHNIQPGFLLYVPIYYGQTEPITLEDRRRKIKGFVYSPFRATDLMSSLLKTEFRDLDIEIYDGQIISQDHLIYDNDTLRTYFSENKPHLNSVKKLWVCGHPWTIYYSPRLHDPEFSIPSQPWLLLIGGLVISLLVFFMIYYLLKLRAANGLKQIITDNATSSLFILNKDGVCTFMNPAAEKLTGYTLREMQTNTFPAIMHSKNADGSSFLRDKFYLYNGSENRNIDQPAHEEYFVKKDGTFFYATCSMKPIERNNIVTGILLEVRDITEEKSNKEAITKQNEELLRINNDLDNFVYTASHDLKAPMSNIEALLNLLQDEIEQDSKSEELKHLTQMMGASVDRFKETIQDLTDISKIQRNNIESKELISIPVLVNEIKTTIVDLIKSTNAKIHENYSQCEFLKFSKTNLKSILFNLISNAIKYRDLLRRPEIYLTTYLEETYCVIEVKDNGLGIPYQNKEKIFQMFRRLHDHVEGSGVGLYLVKRIVENSNGKIEVDSTPGVGSTFKIYLPFD